MLGVKRTYQLSVILFTQEKKLDPTKKKDTDKPEALPTGTRKGNAMHLPKGTKTKRLQGLVQVARLNLTVKAHNSKVLEALRWKLATRGTKEFRQLYPICMTDKDFADRERKVPGYIDGIYLMDWTAIGAIRGRALMIPHSPRKLRRESRQLRSWQRRGDQGSPESGVETRWP